MDRESEKDGQRYTPNTQSRVGPLVTKNMMHGLCSRNTKLSQVENVSFNKDTR